MRLAWIVVLVACVFSSMSFASTCLPGSLQDYIDLGSGGCVVDDLTFFNFQDLGVIVGATPIDPADILVNPLSTPGNSGLSFDFSGLGAGAGQFLQSLFGFSVSATGAPITGVSQSMSGAVATGDAAVTSLLCIGTADPACPTPDTIALLAIDGFSILSGSLGLSPVSTLDFVGDIGIDGGLGGNASLSNVEMRFQAIPEPALWLPLASLLLTLSVIRRKRR